MPSNDKVPGDGKLRASIEQGIADSERLASAFVDAAEAGEGVEDAFFTYKRIFRETVYDRVSYKAKNNATIVMSKDAIDSIARQKDMVMKVDVTAYPEIVKELDPFEPNMRSMLDVCGRAFVDANRIQTAKGQRSTP
jgi:hypothetical protein